MATNILHTLCPVDLFKKQIRKSRALCKSHKVARGQLRAALVAL